MRTVKVDRPDWIDGKWELEGYTFEVDDELRGLIREGISRRANAIAMKALRGVNIYEDEDAFGLLTKQYAECSKHIGKVYLEGEELTDAKRAEVLDSISIIARDSLSNEVAGANALGLGKG